MSEISQGQIEQMLVDFWENTKDNDYKFIWQCVMQRILGMRECLLYLQVDDADWNAVIDAFVLAQERYLMAPGKDPL